MGPLEAYRAKVSAGALREDAAQLDAVEALDGLHGRLNSGGKRGFFRRKEASPKGLYLWGGVGRGKSMLMDMFFETATNKSKRRVHFHAFMQEVHEGLRQARDKGLEDPLQPVADAVVQEAKLLCFDELQITDITDAMLVGRLFGKLFEEGVVVVTTSNRHPDDLYKDGLNRQLFLPFIELIKEHLDVLELVSDTDHRQLALQSESLYFTPLGAEATGRMDTLWKRLAGEGEAPLVLKNKGRDVVVPRFANGAGRGSFADFCEQPLGPADYLMIAEAVSVLLIDDIPVLGRANNNEAKRFVTLVDALYEAGTRLVCSAADEPDALYETGAGAFEFERTASRMIEMRSSDWPKA